LKKNRKLLKIMAEALLEREVLDSTDVDALMAGKKLAAIEKPKTPSNSKTPSNPTPTPVTPNVVLKPQTAPSAAKGGSILG